VNQGPPLSWVVGRGGLLGQHMQATLRQRAPMWSGTAAVPWGRVEAQVVLRRQAGEFLQAAANGPWQVVWAAGAGVTGADRAALAMEQSYLRATLEVLGAAPTPGAGAVFFASSAGAVYAGVSAPPYDENSPVRPLAPYGEAKLASERMLARWAAENGTPVFIGRIANLYGPGQNLAKAQGLISQICRAGLTGQPVSIFVPLDTLRDYIFAPDCAEMIADGLERLRSSANGAAGPVVVTKNLATLRPLTIGAILGETRRIFKRTPRVVLGASPAARFQARDLSLRSVVWPQLDRRALTPLPVGVSATLADLRRRLQDCGTAGPMPAVAPLPRLSGDHR